MVQVHPGPPSNHASKYAAIPTFPRSCNPPQEPFCQLFANFPGNNENAKGWGAQQGDDGVFGLMATQVHLRATVYKTVVGLMPPARGSARTQCSCRRLLLFENPLGDQVLNITQGRIV